MFLILEWLGTFLMGMILGIDGGRGSIFTVPILVYLMKIKPVLAKSYSLFVVGLTSFIGTLFHMMEKLVDFRIGVLFSVPAFLGVFLMRKFGVPSIPEEI